MVPDSLSFLGLQVGWSMRRTTETAAASQTEQSGFQLYLLPR